MRSTTKFLIVTLFIIGGFMLAVSWVYISDYREDRAQELLERSLTVSEGRERFEIYQKLVLLSPTENNFLLAGLEAKEAKYDKLSEYYLKKVKSAEGLYQLGLAYFENEEYQLAEESYQKSLNIKYSEKTHMARTKNYIYLGKFKESLDQCQQSEANDWVQICDMARLATGQIEKISTNSKNREILEIKAIANKKSRILQTYLYLKEKINPQAAIIYLTDYEEEIVDSRDGNIVLAEINYNQGNLDKAAEYLEKAKKIDPFYPQVYKHLEEIYSSLGNENLAKENGLKYRALSWD
jgi:tetratricopeptide (TPR) repeat protein